MAKLVEVERTLKFTRDALLTEKRESDGARGERDLALWRFNEIKKLLE